VVYRVPLTGSVTKINERALRCWNIGEKLHEVVEQYERPCNVSFEETENLELTVTNFKNKLAQNDIYECFKQ
jgi:adenosine deaminase